MMKSRKSQFWWSAISLLLVVGCTSKPKVQEPPPYVSPTSPQVSTPVPRPEAEPEFVPGNTVPPPEVHAETPRVGLVLGGAGVASFATVGLMKRLNEEGVKVDFIVATGWPALFALGYGFLKSIHDLEWFAMRLQEKDFYKAGIFDANRGYHSHESLSQLIQNFFTQTDLSQSRVPIVISASNTELGDSDVFDSGDWKVPLLKTMSVPGIYRPYPQEGSDKEWINSIQGIDVEEAQKRGASKILILEMYDDYFDFIRSAKKETSDSVFRKLYLTELRKSMQKETKDQPLVGRISLKTEPTNFGSRRAAILAGYKEGARLIKALRKQ